MAKSLPWWGVAAFLLVAMDFDNIDIEDVIGASVTQRDVEPEFFEARRYVVSGYGLVVCLIYNMSSASGKIPRERVLAVCFL